MYDPWKGNEEGQKKVMDWKSGGFNKLLDGW